MTDNPRKWFYCNPRSVRDCLKEFGIHWTKFLPEDAMTGRDPNGRCYYWLPPKRVSKPLEQKIGTLDISFIQPINDYHD